MLGSSDNRLLRASILLAGSAIVLLLALALTTIATTPADAAASDASTSSSPEASASGCPGFRFGARTLSRGDCGSDVRTLNWVLNSTTVGGAASLGKRFDRKTKFAVRRFQRSRRISRDGVVGPQTRALMRRAMDRRKATWYGPGLYGNKTACGQRYTRTIVGVAHKKLPCGTRVVVGYGRRTVRLKVIDRGPYAHGAKWDLSNGARKLLGFNSTDQIRVGVVR